MDKDQDLSNELELLTILFTTSGYEISITTEQTNASDTGSTRFTTVLSKMQQH